MCCSNLIIILLACKDFTYLQYCTCTRSGMTFLVVITFLLTYWLDWFYLKWIVFETLSRTMCKVNFFCAISENSLAPSLTSFCFHNNNIYALNFCCCNDTFSENCWNQYYDLHISLSQATVYVECNKQVSVRDISVYKNTLNMLWATVIFLGQITVQRFLWTNSPSLH